MKKSTHKSQRKFNGKKTKKYSWSSKCFRHTFLTIQKIGTNLQQEQQQQFL